MIGFTILLIGLVLSVPGIPGPGILIIIGGLAVLATEYVWAKRYLKKIKDGGQKLKDAILPKSKPPDTVDK